MLLLLQGFGMASLPFVRPFPSIPSRRTRSFLHRGPLPMKTKNNRRSALRPLHLIALSFVLFILSLSNANGQTTTFAQFFEVFGTNDFVFTNNGTSGEFSQIPGGVPVFFLYQNILDLPPSISGIQSAHLFISTTTTSPGFSGSGVVSQPLNQSVTIQVIRDTPAPEGVGGGSRTNLLTAVFLPNSQTPTLVGSDGGNAATMSATTPDHTVIFTSHFLSFAATTQRNLAFSFSSITPSFSLGAGGFLVSNVSAGSGTFASSPVPVYTVPSSASVTVSGRIVTPGGRGLANAEVLLLDQDGQAHVFRTGSFGHFQFEGLTSGQSVAIGVRSRQYTFDPIFLTLDDSVSDLVISPATNSMK